MMLTSRGIMNKCTGKIILFDSEVRKGLSNVEIK
jgi:hypothetical protein